MPSPTSTETFLRLRATDDTNPKYQQTINRIQPGHDEKPKTNEKPAIAKSTKQTRALKNKTDDADEDESTPYTVMN